MDIIVRAQVVKLEVAQDGTNLVILNGKSFMLEDGVEEVVQNMIDNPSPILADGEEGGYYFLRFRGNSPRCFYFNFVASYKYDSFLDKV
jgi:uncharacterized protein YlzI (FlbEa/FlbD family)